MLKNTCLLLTLTLALSAPAAIEIAYAGQANDVIPPPVPANLQLPAGYQPFLIGHATGTQNYICLPTASGTAWAFVGPQATVFDDRGEQLTTHFLSPNPIENGVPRATWQHSRDTSTVWAAAVASSTDPAFVSPGAVSWLLLQAVGAQHGAAGDKLSKTTYIQRVNTIGGVAPSTGCSSPGEIGSRAFVPYSADYVFYRN